jgi:photosystem I P700 chlorophyll a apoprotein A2
MQIAWQGTYSSWLTQSAPAAVVSAHAVRDPQLGVSGIDGLSSRIVSTSGLYPWLYALGFRFNSSIMFSATLLFGSASFLTIGAIFHAMHLSSTSYQTQRATRFDGASIFVNQLITGIGLASILWAGHIIHLSGPVSSGIAIKWGTLLLLLPHPDGLAPFLSLQWNEYATILTAS